MHWLLATILAVATLAGGQEFTEIPGELTVVSPSLTYVWGVTINQQVFTCKRPCNGSDWYRPPGALVQLDVDDTDVWGVTELDGIYTRPIDGSGDWQNIPGELKHVSASGNGFIWGVSYLNAIFKCEKPCIGNWVPVDGLLTQLDGGQNRVYGVSDFYEVFYRPVDGSGRWTKITGIQLQQISASATYYVYGLDLYDRIYRCEKPCNDAADFELVTEQPLEQFRQIDACADALFGISKVDNHIWKQEYGL